MTPLITPELYAIAAQNDRRRRTGISTEQMAAQLDALELLKARKLAARAVGVDWNFADEVKDEMTDRLTTAWLEILTFEDEMDYADLIDTQECARV